METVKSDKNIRKSRKSSKRLMDRYVSTKEEVKISKEERTERRRSAFAISRKLIKKEKETPTFEISGPTNFQNKTEEALTEVSTELEKKDEDIVWVDENDIKYIKPRWIFPSLIDLSQIFSFLLQFFYISLSLFPSSLSSSLPVNQVGMYPAVSLVFV